MTLDPIAINGAGVAIPDVLATNGVVHVIGAVLLSASINQCVRPAWRYYLLFWPPRRSARVLGVLARGILGLLARTSISAQVLLPPDDDRRLQATQNI